MLSTVSLENVEGGERNRGMGSIRMHQVHVHVLMRDERRKEKRSKQGQRNNKAKATQHTQGSHFS